MKTVRKFGTVTSLAIVAYMATMGVKAAQQEKIEQDHAVMMEQMECLALNIYFEARNQSKLGKLAVAWVTLNRVKHSKYPDTICEVVWDEKQFSWTHDGKSDRPNNDEKWMLSKQIAFYAMENHTRDFDPTEGAVMYHAVYTDPYWTTDYIKTTRIDSHVFYKEDL